MENPQRNNDDITIGISIGDVNGIGPEVIIKTFSDTRVSKLYTPVIYGNTKVLSYYKKALDNNDFVYFNPRDGQFAKHKVNVINVWDDHVDITPGVGTVESGKRSLQSLEAACADLDNENIDALVTAPINKHSMQGEDFNFPGHTEFLTSRFKADDSLMFLVNEDFRIGVVTGHIPIKDISQAITSDLVRKKLKLMFNSLKVDFGSKKPKVAVLGLNPHAGEGGMLGNEEIDVIKPVIEEFKQKGNLVFGPFPADGFFGTDSQKQFDGVLAMYHDQGLIPFKQLAFDNGVNFTAGLPIVRTSPDHGTAYDIVTKGLANEESFRAAYFLAADIVKNRREQNKAGIGQS